MQESLSRVLKTHIIA